MFDPRLKAVVIQVLDISYGAEAGLNQAIDMAADELKNVKVCFSPVGPSYKNSLYKKRSLSQTSLSKLLWTLANSHLV